jgi:hypothetical protein
MKSMKSRCIKGTSLAVLGLFALAALAGRAPAEEDQGRADGEVQENWIDMLADGLEPWVVDAREEQREEHEKKWTLKDDILQNAGGGFGFLRYGKELGDFEFKGDYRLPQRGNSGIGIRSVPFTGPSRTRPSFAAYELQLLADHGKPPSEHSTMSLYRYVAPRANPSKPAGEWNRFHIICRGPRIVIHLNGEEILGVDQSEHEEIKDKPLKGFLLLQNHGSTAEFRNLKLLVE